MPRRLAVAAGPAAVVALVLWNVLRIRAANGGTFGYCVDDAYIHLAIAKNLHAHGVFGVTPYGFTAASSSPLWSLLLALHPAEWLPAVLATAAGAVAAGLAASMVRGALPAALVGAAVALLTPLAPVALTGMEHTLQLLFALCFLRALARELEGGEHSRLALAAVLLTAARFEGLFLACCGCLLLLRRGRIRRAFVVGASALVPPAVSAIVSLWHGWWPLPNSVVMKAVAGSGLILPYLQRFWTTLHTAPHATALLVLAVCCWLAGRRGTSRDLCAVWIGTAVLHLCLAHVGWFYRYEAWLVGTGIVVCARTALELKGRSALLVGAAAALALVPLSTRALRAHQQIPLAAHDIFRQQRQLGLFLAGELPPGTSVAMNDIGAATYFADVHLVDLVGLASMDLARAVRGGDRGVEMVRRITRSHGVRFALLHARLFRGVLPPEWRVAGSWRVRNPVVLGSDTVTFFATDAADVPWLEAALRDFAPKLPSEVEVRVGP